MTRCGKCTIWNTLSCDGSSKGMKRRSAIEPITSAPAAAQAAGRLLFCQAALHPAAHKSLSNGRIPMEVSTQKMLDWCRTLLNANSAAAKRTLQEYLASIPRLESLSDVPRGTPVLVRGDVDAKPGPQIGDGDERLSSMVDTLKFGISRGWKQVIFGHIGRKPEGSLAAVARRIGELVGQDVPVLSDWWHEPSQTIPDAITQRIAAANPGSVLVLENTRQYEIERTCCGRRLRMTCRRLHRDLRSLPTSLRPRWLRSTSTKHFPQAASTAPRRSCRRRWIESRWGNTSPASSMDRCRSACALRLFFSAD